MTAERWEMRVSRARRQVLETVEWNRDAHNAAYTRRSSTPHSLAAPHPVANPVFAAGALRLRAGPRLPKPCGPQAGRAIRLRLRLTRPRRKKWAAAGRAGGSGAARGGVSSSLACGTPRAPRAAPRAPAPPAACTPWRRRSLCRGAR